MKEYENLLDSQSGYLFAKPYAELNMKERTKLSAYVTDVSHPQWKSVIIDSKDTGCKVNNLGVIIDKDGKELKRYDHGGYYTVYIAAKSKTYLVHRLVAEAFIPNPENKPHVNHINGLKNCSWAGNLEWVTPKENSDHAWEHNLVNNNGERQGNSKYRNDTIRKVCKLLEENKLSIAEISEITGVTEKTISEVKTRRRWRSVSKDFKLPPTRKPMYSDDQIHAACKLLENPGISLGEISQRTGVSIYGLKDICKKTSYMRISKDYNIPKRINAGQYNPVHKYSADQIETVCKMLTSGKYSKKDISNATGVNLSLVYDVNRGTKWKNISSKYNIVTTKAV